MYYNNPLCIRFRGIMNKLQKYRFFTYIEFTHRKNSMTAERKTSVRRYIQNLGGVFTRFWFLIPTGVRAAPAEVLKLIRCTCSSDSPCGPTSRCSCSKAQMSCSEFCSCYNDDSTTCCNKWTVFGNDDDDECE